MNQLEYAADNKVSPLVKRIASVEGLPVKRLLSYIRDGRAVIPLNKKHRISRPCGIGYGLRTKVNANIGASPDKVNLKGEIEKLNTCVKYGADTVMDLSVGGNLPEIRKELLRACPLPFGTVPVYEMAVLAQDKRGDLFKFTPEDMLEVLQRQAEEGVDFFTIHAGATKKSLSALKKHPRVMNIVSRGGAILAGWMRRHKKENPFYEFYDKILDIAYKYDITLSLGDALRPGSIFDASDSAQIAELKILGGLAMRARKRKVQVIIEGPGHVPLDQIEKNILLEKKFCRGAPFYVLGPLVTDVAAGYDQISGAIGGALAAAYGADFLCYLTPSEHLRHPSLDDVREGVIASRIAAHAADLVKRNKIALGWDKEMSLARAKRNWKKQIRLSIDPEKAERYRASSLPSNLGVCTMCGKYCSIKLGG